ASINRPDIVIIMADDIGYSDIGCFGGEIETPNLDRLAAGGLRYTNFYSENMCWVSRAALLTGIYHTSSLRDHAIHPRCLTLPEALKANGYTTRMSGKWHLGGKDLLSIYPNDRGFEDYYGIMGGAASYFAPYSLSRNRQNIESEAQDPDFYLTDAISENAVKMVQSTPSDNPLFLYVAYTTAHWPLHAREKDIQHYQNRYSLGWDKLRAQRMKRMKRIGILDNSVPLSERNPKVPAWESAPNREWQQRRMEVYAAQITSMDRGIGQVIDALEQSGRFDNTLIFFTIDNGGCHVEYAPTRKGYSLPDQTRDGKPMIPGNLPDVMPGPEITYQSYGYGWANASNTPFRLYKQFDHEGGIRTPMIAHWPRGIPEKGKLVRTTAHLIDLMPTILNLTESKLPNRINGETPMAMDGISLAPSLNGETQIGHEELYFTHNKGNAVRTKNWKLVQIKKQKWELYDLRKDPTESNDLASRMPQKVTELENRWEVWRALQKKKSGW
ncbi:MAG TPA: arylsulfatase, partial [Verrucomicrobia bacterium]|nr:arylsulfatase [Verrucomicrobiota bacterium]